MPNTSLRSSPSQKVSPWSTRSLINGRHPTSKSNPSCLPSTSHPPTDTPSNFTFPIPSSPRTELSFTSPKTTQRSSWFGSMSLYLTPTTPPSGMQKVLSRKITFTRKSWSSFQNKKSLNFEHIFSGSFPLIFQPTHPSAFTPPSTNCSTSKSAQLRRTAKSTISPSTISSFLFFPNAGPVMATTTNLMGSV